MLTVHQNKFSCALLAELAVNALSDLFYQLQNEREISTGIFLCFVTVLDKSDRKLLFTKLKFNVVVKKFNVKLSRKLSPMHNVEQSIVVHN